MRANENEDDFCRYEVGDGPCMAGRDSILHECDEVCLVGHEPDILCHPFIGEPREGRTGE